MMELQLRLHWMRLYHAQAARQQKRAAGMRVAALECMVERQLQTEHLRQIYAQGIDAIPAMCYDVVGIGDMTPQAGGQDERGENGHSE